MPPKYCHRLPTGQSCRRISLTMIAHIRGRLDFKSPEYAVVDVNGVGYRIFIPLPTYYALPEIGCQVQLHTYTLVREDALQLYGFYSEAQRELFVKLIGVSRIGPRLARNIMSGLPENELKRAIVTRDADRISAVPGVGQKTAQRLVVELQDKIIIPEAELESASQIPISADMLKDAISALINLGYKPEFARRAVRRAWQESGDSGGLEEIIKQALKHLAKY